MRMTLKILIACVVTLAIAGCSDISLKGIIDQKLVGLGGPIGRHRCGSDIQPSCRSRRDLRERDDGDHQLYDCERIDPLYDRRKHSLKHGRYFLWRGCQRGNG